MSKYTFDEICESQDFEHDQEFVTVDYMKQFIETVLNNTGDITEELLTEELKALGEN